MNGVRVVTDSVSDIPGSVLEELGIGLVPVIVRFGAGEELRDRIDISVAEFMERLVSSREPVRTSQPSPGEFIEAFRQAGEGGHPVVSVQVSSGLSGTYQSACIARDIVRDEGLEVTVVDTQSGSMGQGWAAIAAARAARAGQSLERVAGIARDVSRRAKVLFAIDTLAYLQRNGRLGRVQAMLGSLLNLKPILVVREGELALGEAVLGAERVMDRLVGAITRSVRGGARVALGIVHAAARERAEQLRQELARVYDVVETIFTETGPAIAANIGPGAYGAMLYEVD